MNAVHYRLIRHTALVFVLLTALATAACGKRGGKVAGVVTYQGKPVPAGTVLFLGDDKNPVRSPIHNDGSYQVNNVPLGRVKVAVLTPPPSPPPRKDDPKPPPPSEPTPAIPPKYANPDTSGLTYDVTSGSQTHPIDLK